MYEERTVIVVAQEEEEKDDEARGGCGGRRYCSGISKQPATPVCTTSGRKFRFRLLLVIEKVFRSTANNNLAL